MAIEIFNRYEHKYKLDTKTFNKVLEIMDEHMELDSHCGEHSLYTIANIYYDTKDNSLIRESLSKPAYKEKLRLRSYGVPDMDSKVFLEIKKKYRGLVNKRRTTLELGEAYGTEYKNMMARQKEMPKQKIFVFGNQKQAV